MSVQKLAEHFVDSKESTIRASVYLERGRQLPLNARMKCYLVPLDEEEEREGHELVSEHGASHLGSVELFEDVAFNSRDNLGRPPTTSELIAAMNYYLEHDAFAP